MAKAAAKALSEISFNASDDDQDLIHQIVRRADELGLIYPNYSKMTCSMDLTAVHCNGNPLRLRELLAADDFNFMHDICGIAACLDRDTAKFTKDFSPRFSLRKAA